MRCKLNRASEHSKAGLVGSSNRGLPHAGPSLQLHASTARRVHPCVRGLAVGNDVQDN
jgi:hypothetical protein